MRTVNLGLLRSFVTVVDSGGFTSAEKRVHRTQSTISQQVKRLEIQLGATLLTRSKGGVIPTVQGERVLAYARRMLALESDMAAAVSAQRESVVVRLGVTDDFAQLYLPALLESVRITLPRVSLRVTCDLSVVLRGQLAQGAFDLALYKRTSVDGAGVRILSEPIQWVAANGYPLDRSRPLPLLLFPRGCVYRQRALAQLDTANRAWTLSFESPSTVSVQAAVRAGLGVTTLTPSSIPEGCRTIAKGLPPLGRAELVYEFGSDPSEETKQLLVQVLKLVNSRRR